MVHTDSSEREPRLRRVPPDSSYYEIDLRGRQLVGLLVQSVTGGLAAALAQSCDNRIREVGDRDDSTAVIVHIQATESISKVLVPERVDIQLDLFVAGAQLHVRRLEIDGAVVQS